MYWVHMCYYCKQRNRQSFLGMNYISIFLNEHFQFYFLYKSELSFFKLEKRGYLPYYWFDYVTYLFIELDFKPYNRVPSHHDCLSECKNWDDLITNIINRLSFTLQSSYNYQNKTLIYDLLASVIIIWVIKVRFEKKEFLITT